MEEQLLMKPAVYMRPHKNRKGNATKPENAFKPKVMLGDLRKPNVEFTSDLA